MSKIIKHVISNEKDFEVLREKWVHLSQGKNMTYFQSYDWNVLLYRNWHNNLYNRLFSKVIIYESDNIIAPLIIQRFNVSLGRLGRKAGIYFLGTDSYSDYIDFIYSDVNGLDCLLEYIKKDNKRLHLFLKFISQDSLTNKYIPSRTKKYSDVCVYIKIEDNIQNYNSKLSKHTRQNLRTAFNRMKKDGVQYEYEIKKKPLSDIEIEELSKIHLDRVLNKNKIDTSSIKRKISSTILYWRLKYNEINNNIIKDAMKSQNNSFTLIVKLNKKVVGYLYGFVEESGVIRICQNCFNEEYKFYSPVFRACYDFICNCCGDNNYKEIDFTRGNEEYKYKLGGIERKIYSYEVK